MFLVDDLGLAGEDPQVQPALVLIQLGGSRLVDAMAVAGYLPFRQNTILPHDGSSRDRIDGGNQNVTLPPHDFIPRRQWRLDQGIVTLGVSAHQDSERAWVLHSANLLFC